MKDVFKGTIFTDPYVRQTWNKRNAQSMVAGYKNALNITPFWRIFKRHQLKKAIKLWTKIKESES